MTDVVLKAEKREKLGTLIAKKIKKADKIPAVIYGQKGNINLTVNKKEFEFEYFKGNLKATVIELELDGKKIKVIAHVIDVDPVSDRPIHIDFFNCDESKTVRAQPKLNFANKDKSTGLKRGGFLNVSLRKIDVICDSAENVPTSIDVDVAAMKVGDKVRASDLKLPKGVKLNKKSDALIAGIIGRASKDEEEASTTDAAAEGTSKEAAPAENADKK